jgi:Protein of unknown function (DUF3465)
MVAEVPAAAAGASAPPRLDNVTQSAARIHATMRRGEASAWLGAVAVLVTLAACDDVDNAAFDSAYHAMSAAEVTVRGTVTLLLPDAPAGADGPHERFDVLVDGITVEIDHNIDLAPRAPVAPGDAVVIHGQFEPDPGHPVIHYTHHATGQHEGGWIEVNGSTYE